MNVKVQQGNISSIDRETLDAFVGALMLALQIPEGKHLIFIVGGGLTDTNRHILRRWVAEHLWMVKENDPVDWLSILGRELEITIARRRIELLGL
ncbi:MAG: hypothetical protein V7731_07665 [Amphritea sp.]